MQRTMLELLNQLDGFSSDERIKVSLEISLLFLHSSHNDFSNALLFACL